MLPAAFINAMDMHGSHHKKARSLLTNCQCLYVVFHTPCSLFCPASEGLGVPQQPEGDRPRTADLGYLKGWPKACSVLLCNTTGGAGTAQGWAGHQSAGGEQLCCASPTLCILFPCLLSFLFLSHLFLSY